MLLASLFAAAFVFKLLAGQYGRSLSRAELLFLYRYLYLVGLLCHIMILA